jgi:hypothetical protein
LGFVRRFVGRTSSLAPFERWLVGRFVRFMGLQRRQLGLAWLERRIRLLLRFERRQLGRFVGLVGLQRRFERWLERR